ncbi:dTMP kinase [Lentibacillus amyloliquefaciens]|uniref:Thymidylate kinase n=1 Tax=Lentibacillus amyloliquefaciens TaxID=1472767 RepID=A0A0U4FUI2_9BACI|nr:dTMP kinase [Lentibacillus amyloliquefaciens]ALX49461.1 thymidylate kinase [Lentibacillus amyloliquefaciens]
MRGYFITFEGGEGSGKSSILKSAEQKLADLGLDVLSTREPGGIEIAEKIREIILNPEHTAMDARTEALLYAAARRQHLTEKVLPALKEGKIILCDRFVDSSLAYQGFARKLGIEEVFTINKFAIQDLMPDKTLFFDIEPKKGLERIAANKDRERNRLDLETIQFHEDVYEAYQMLVSKFPDRIQVINADQSFEQVESEAVNAIAHFLKNG